MEVWKNGSMEVWKYGSMEVWKYATIMQVCKFASVPEIANDRDKPKYQSFVQKGPGQDNSRQPENDNDKLKQIKINRAEPKEVETD